MLTNAAIVASLLTAVSAHQNFHQFWVNDVSPGYQVSIRMPPNNSPVTDLTSKDLACNVNGNVVPSGVTTTTAKEGDTIKVKWDSSSHPGPITHFLYGPVDDASMATGIGSWIKIDEFDSKNGTWANEIMMTQDMTYSFKLPTGLASGEYLLRSEMLALHGAQTIGGAQFYMGCAQLKITGTGSAGSCTPEIQIPGAYKADDTNIYIPNIYYGFDISTYTAPGGKIAVCGGSGSAPVATSTSTVKPVPASSAMTSASVKPIITSAAEETSSAAGVFTSTAPVVGIAAVASRKKSACRAKTSTAAGLATPVLISNSAIPSSTRKSACKAKTSSAMPVSTKKSACKSKTSTAVPTSTKKSACKAKTSSGAAGITDGGVLNGNAVVPKATTLMTSTRSTPPDIPTETGASSGNTSGETSAPPAGTTLDNLLAWLSSFYTANKGTSYNADTAV
ncbi:putative endo-beta-1,4-glucanase D [Rhexocercosporidium sp. MPI-PUGE-AT-0058]|nr:putative endo-beta-1,4-glucanase D [Rhexocercosporidium sp. MPI-PUGE-AT-0058]